jgi:hypothetical protein
VTGRSASKRGVLIAEGFKAESATRSSRRKSVTRNGKKVDSRRSAIPDKKVLIPIATVQYSASSESRDVFRQNRRMTHNEQPA